MHLMMLTILSSTYVNIDCSFAEEELEMFGLNVAFLAIVTDCGANVKHVFNNTP